MVLLARQDRQDRLEREPGEARQDRQDQVADLARVDLQDRQDRQDIVARVDRQDRQALRDRRALVRVQDRRALRDRPAPKDHQALRAVRGQPVMNDNLKGGATMSDFDMVSDVIPAPAVIKTRPYWMMAGGVFRQEDCDALVGLAADLGFGNGTYSDGRKRGNVAVRFLTRDDGPIAAGWIEAFIRISEVFAAAFSIDIEPEGIESLQISRWQEGDGYGMHVDHDTRNILSRDRKLSLYSALSANGGGLEVDRLGHVQCQVGDVLAFPAMVPHAAPVQGEGERYSVVAWIPGPDWR